MQSIERALSLRFRREFREGVPHSRLRVARAHTHTRDPCLFNFRALRFALFVPGRSGVCRVASAAGERGNANILRNGQKEADGRKGERERDKSGA